MHKICRRILLVFNFLHINSKQRVLIIVEILQRLCFDRVRNHYLDIIYIILKT